MKGMIGTQINNVNPSDSLSRSCIDIFAQGSPKKISEVLSEQGLADCPIKVDISEEGLNAYKQMYQNDNKKEFKSLNLRLMPGEMSWGNEGWPDIEEFLGWGTLWKMMDDRMPQNYHSAFVSIKDKAAALLKGYAEKYDEIIKGYEDGTRVRYVVDMDTEDLYRKATMEEDLEYLRIEFEERAASLELIHKRDCKVREVHAKSTMDGFPYGSSMRDVLKYGTLYRNMKDEENIVDIKKKLIDAASSFVSRYKEFGLSKLNLKVL